ncbi:hypothetical protein HZH68_008039 [Vespula germanica]|uniref:Uncharacterized protein n=1 Tax=Vespula germanica TaxID=30212 RepID=A0A834K4U4_VESGE|nr:hypothetical protein HZH68_008039 [Vespula germanica]
MALEEEEAATKKKLIGIKMKLWSGDTGLPEMTTKSSVRPILTINGSVLLRISKSTHRSSRSTHSLEVIEKNQCKVKLWSGDTGLPEMTTKSSVRSILIVNGSVLLRISKSTHRSSRSTHSLEVIEKNQCKVKLWSGDTGLPEMTTKSSVRPILIVNVGILGCERGQQRRTFDRLLQLLVQLCFGLRRGNLENFAEDIPAIAQKTKKEVHLAVVAVDPSNGEHLLNSER